MHGVLNDPAIDVDVVCRRNDLHKGLAALDAKSQIGLCLLPVGADLILQLSYPGRSAAGNLLQLLSGNDGALRRKF